MPQAKKQADLPSPYFLSTHEIYGELVGMSERLTEIAESFRKTREWLASNIAPDQGLNTVLLQLWSNQGIQQQYAMIEHTLLFMSHQLDPRQELSPGWMVVNNIDNVRTAIAPYLPDDLGAKFRDRNESH